MIAQKYVWASLYFLVIFSFLVSGCGYRFSVEGMGPSIDGGVVQDDGPLVPLVIRALLDRTFYSDLGFKYTKYMRQEFAASSGAKVVYDDGQADFVMEGEIVSVSVTALSFSTTRRQSPSRKVSIMDCRAASSILRMADDPLARISPCERCDPKTWSSGPNKKDWPTAAASCPMDKWAGPKWLYSMPW